MKILLTGAAGFVGWKTTGLLVDAGHEVVGIDDLNDYYDPRLKQWRLDQNLGLEGFCFVELNLEDKAGLRKLFEENDFDAVINLAARAGVRYSMENPGAYVDTNVVGFVHLLELMREFAVKQLVLPSTSTLYAGQDMPFVETLSVNEPISPYAATKKAAEMMAYTYHYLYGINTVIVRYFTIYGPAGRPDMSPLRFMKWIDEGTPITLYGDGSQSRDFVFVDDVARGTVAALGVSGYEVINLGGGNNPVSMNQMIAAFEKELGKKALIDQQPFIKSDMMHTYANIDKAKELLGWEPKVPFEEGVRRMVAWYRENEELVKELKL